MFEDNNPYNNDVQITVKEDTKNKLQKMAKNTYMDIDGVINCILMENKKLHDQVHRQRFAGNFAKSIVSKKNSTNVPSIIRHHFDIKPGDTLFWDLLDGEIVLKVDEPKEDWI